MSPLVASLNFYLSLGTIIALAGTVVLAIDWKMFRGNTLVAFIFPYILSLSFLIALSASVLTLLYSEVFGFLPCGLCWLERICLYPQVIILGIALWKKEERWAPLYGLALSVIGLVVALYHHYIQMGGHEVVGCPATGVSCSQRIIFEFGFVTFPFMAAVLFLLLALLYALLLYFKRVV